MAGTLKAVDSANLRGEIAGALVYTFCRSEDLWQSRWGRKPRVRLPVDRALRPPGFSVPPPDCSPGRVPMKRRSGLWSAESPFPASVTRCRRCRSSVCLVVFWRGPKAATTRGTPAAPLRQRRLLGRSGPGRLEATLSSDGDIALFPAGAGYRNKTLSRSCPTQKSKNFVSRARSRSAALHGSFRLGPER